MPLFYLVRNQTKPILTHWYVITFAFDCFTVMPMSFMICQNDYFGFGILTPNHSITQLKTTLIKQLLDLPV